MAQAKIKPRAEDYAQWYQDIIQHADLAELERAVCASPGDEGAQERMQQATSKPAKELTAEDAIDFASKRRDVASAAEAWASSKAA